LAREAAEASQVSLEPLISREEPLLAQFQWVHLPIQLLRTIAEDIGLAAGSAATDLAKRYGTPPDEEFVRENWDVLRDQWLPNANEAREALVEELWELGVGHANARPSSPKAEMAFLRTCNNARRLRKAVLAVFVRFGEQNAGKHPPKKIVTHNRPVASTVSASKTDIYDIADRLWETADELRANSHLKSGEYSIPVLGLIFLKFADSRFTQAESELAGKSTGRREIGKADYQARGVLYLPEQSRFANLLTLKEGDNLGKAINDAMAAIEDENPSLKGVLPRTYQSLTNATLVTLLRLVNSILGDIEGDAFGKVYEYFLGKFARAEGAKGGEYFTPTPIVRLIVQIIEPFSGKILDPACGSGGMFVQSARFVEEHRNGSNGRLSIYGQERVEETVKLCKMNLAVHGLEGQISQSNSYYEDPFRSVGQFDYVMANPPFNVNRIDKVKLEGDPRFPFGLPKADNGNYIWIQEFYSTLNDHGRAGFVMANSAADAGGSELEIRKKLIAAHAVDVVVAVAPNFFYTVTLPVTLWFLDRGKRGTDREGEILFIDARKIFHQIDRAHRDWQSEQIEYLANIARLYRGEPIETSEGSAERMSVSFPNAVYVDVPGLCAAVTLDRIAAENWSLNPGRYVGVAAAKHDGVGFRVRLEELNEELEKLNTEAAILQERIATNVMELLI
jgi:type I restriction enzyme M protein